MNRGLFCFAFWNMPTERAAGIEGKPIACSKDARSELRSLDVGVMNTAGTY